MMTERSFSLVPMESGDASQGHCRQQGLQAKCNSKKRLAGTPTTRSIHDLLIAHVAWSELCRTQFSRVKMSRQKHVTNIQRA